MNNYWKNLFQNSRYPFELVDRQISCSFENSILFQYNSIFQEKIDPVHSIMT